MLPIRESCYGRQRKSLKIVIHSRVRFIAAYVSVSVYNKQSEKFRFSFKHRIFQLQYFTADGLHTHIYTLYVYDLHLIVPKFKAIR